MATSPHLLDELARALSYQRVRKYFKQPDEKISALSKLFRAAALLVEPTAAPDVIMEEKGGGKMRRSNEAEPASGKVKLVEVVQSDYLEASEILVSFPDEWELV